MIDKYFIVVRQPSTVNRRYVFGPSKERMDDISEEMKSFGWFIVEASRLTTKAMLKAAAMSNNPDERKKAKEIFIEQF